MHKTVVINVVGLTPALIGPSMPALSAWAGDGAVARIKSAFPAVTCTAQADYLTGRHPDTHGVVGNGWYGREIAEVTFWKQSNRLVQAPKIWETARAADPSFTCANLFWWFNMYSTADYSVTPRPMYPADGRKVPDVYTTPQIMGWGMNTSRTPAAASIAGKSRWKRWWSWMAPKASKTICAQAGASAASVESGRTARNAQKAAERICFMPAVSRAT